MKDNNIENIDEYAVSASVKELPTGDYFTEGVSIGWTAPAKWWNGLFGAITKRLGELFTTVSSMHSELKNAISTIGELDPSTNTQLKNALLTVGGTKGQANGVATLDANGLLPSSQLPTSSIEIIGYLDAANEHTLPSAEGKATGSEIIITSDGYITQSTAWSVPAGGTLTALEVTQGNTLIALGYVFTLFEGTTVLGTIAAFAENGVTLNDESHTVIPLPNENDLSASSVPATVDVPCFAGDTFIIIDNHWIRLTNSNSVTSVNGMTGAVTIPLADTVEAGNELGVTSNAVDNALNSALADYDNRSVTAEKYYNKTESDNNYPRFPDFVNTTKIMNGMGSYTVQSDGFIQMVCNGTESSISLSINNGNRFSQAGTITGLLIPVKKNDIIVMKYYVQGNAPTGVYFMPFRT